VIVAAGLMSLMGLTWRWLVARPGLLFATQAVFDLSLVTFGLAIATTGLPSLLFRGLYVMVITPVCLVTVPGGIVVTLAASLAHLALLVVERGGDWAVLTSLDALVPPVVFVLIAQQCFFYGGHLERKNADLAALAARLEESRVALAGEARTSATLVEIARVLESTLDADELMTRVTHTLGSYLRADWGATFLVDADHGTFRMVGVTDPDIAASAAGEVEFPLVGWPDLTRLGSERILVLDGPAVTRVPTAFTGGLPLATVLVAGIYRADLLTGFLAAGYRAAAAEAPAAARALVAGIADHAATVLSNARLLADLRLAADMKTEFVGAVSHELRSPLNVVIGYAEMLAAGELGPLSDEQAAAVERTRSQAVALLEMITALLDMNRLEAGRLPVTQEPVDVVALTTEVIEQIPAAWRRPEVALRLELPAAAPSLVSDRGKLKTILRNLLHNALKFTRGGEVVLRCEPGPGGAVVFSVHDTGIGIPADALSQVFELFRQVPGAGGGGVGLGLHLVRRLAQALGGRVDVASTVGVGSVFTVTLLPPVAEAHAA